MNRLSDSVQNFEECTSDISDVEAAVSFVAQFMEEKGDDHVPFSTSSLSEAIAEACFVPVESRKIIALYFHNKNDAFSKMFCSNLLNGEVRHILESTFYLLGWDVSNTLYHNALKKSLDENLDNEVPKAMMFKKSAALFIIYPIENSVSVFAMLHGPSVEVKQLLSALENVEQMFKSEIANEIELNNKKENIQNENDIGSKEFQQLMFDRLGDRDYDCFEFDQHNYLKENIGFAIFGMPQSVDGYNSEQTEKIEETYKQIQTQNDCYAEWQKQIVVSFIYNCIEPLPEEKLKRLLKYPDYNPYNDMTPLPIYVIRKCIGSENPCRIFIDSDNRVYNTWKDYIEDNKLHKCTMVLPKEGRYNGDDNEQVLIERHLSPSCGITHTVLRTTDVVGAVAGLASSGVVFIAAMIPAITLAPALLTSAIATGAAVGVYSIGRSAVNIYDKFFHRESLSFANSEARGAYINILAGTLGFVGAGATTAVSQFASNGIKIGQGAQYAVNTINVVNIGTSGIGIANSSYQVYDEWRNEQQTPSLLTVVQLSSSILFFGNAVYNFQAAHTIIEEAQTNALRDYQKSLRSNRHRKMLNKMMKETIHKSNGDVQKARAEVISTVRNIGNRDDVFAILTRNNKLFNKEGVRFSAENGEIRLNGVAIDLVEFGLMTRNQRTNFLIDLPSTSQPTAAVARTSETRIVNTVQKIFTNNRSASIKYGGLIVSGCSFARFAATLLRDVSDYLQNKVLEILVALTDKVLEFVGLEIFTQHFPDISNEPLGILLQFVMDFLKKKMNDHETKYQQAKNKAMEQSDFDEEEFNKQWGVHPDTKRRVLFWFDKIVNSFIHGGSIVENLLEELIQYVLNVLAEKLRDVCDAEERNNRRELTEKNPYKIRCSICNGYYFSKNSS